MGIGDSVKAAVTSAINNIGSEIIITPYTQASSDSGYSGQVETDSDTVTTVAIPFEEFKTVIKDKFGDLETGGFQLAVKHDLTFEISGTIRYKATYQDEVYDITQLKRYSIEDVLVAWILTLSKRLD